MPSTKFNKQNRDKSHSARERIVETATGLFESQGFAATGINQIIAESKTAKASFTIRSPRPMVCQGNPVPAKAPAKNT